jgi:hypothetical protein
MILIDEPVQPGFRVALGEEIREVRGKPSFVAGGKPPGSWIDLSPVVTIPLAEKMTDDAELANFIKAEQDKYRYDYVRLRCSFCPAEGEKFDKAWLEVELRPSVPGVSEPPLTWSVRPGSEYDKVEITDAAKIGSDGKFLSAEVSSSSTKNVKLYSIRSYREGGPNPFWEMQSTELAVLDGSFAFHLVVRSPTTVKTDGSLKLSTIIGTRKFLVFHSEHPHPEEPVQTFVLPAASATPAKG